MLIEQPMPMKDPGELPGFCSVDCSVAFGRKILQESVDQGAMMIDLPCGCFAAVLSVAGSGFAMPWNVCEASLGFTDSAMRHRLESHSLAVQIARQRLMENN